jgi:hypothetical protein
LGSLARIDGSPRQDHHGTHQDPRSHVQRMALRLQRLVVARSNQDAAVFDHFLR